MLEYLVKQERILYETAAGPPTSLEPVYICLDLYPLKDQHQLKFKKYANEPTSYNVFTANEPKNNNHMCIYKEQQEFSKLDSFLTETKV